MQEAEGTERGRPQVLLSFLSAFEDMLSVVAQQQVAQEVKEVASAATARLSGHIVQAQPLEFADAAFQKGRQLSKASGTALRCIMPTQTFLRWLRISGIVSRCEQAGRLMAPISILHCDEGVFHLSFDAQRQPQYARFRPVSGVEGVAVTMVEIHGEWMRRSDRFVLHTVRKGGWAELFEKLHDAISLDKMRQFKDPSPELRSAMDTLPRTWFPVAQDTQWDDMPICVWLKQIKEAAVPQAQASAGWWDASSASWSWSSWTGWSGSSSWR